jgi:transposase
MAKSAAPHIISLSPEPLERLLGELRGALAPATYELVEALLRTLSWVLGVLEHQKASLGRLRRLLFGQQTEKTAKVLPTSAAAAPGAAAACSGQAKPRAKGHGRNGAEAYPGARRLQVPHPQFHVGDLCPKCLKGKLYLFRTPARIVRIVAQPLLDATVFELERLRGALCGALLTAPAPPEAGVGKYDPSVGVMLALTRYGAGLPMYRTGKWQNHFGVPLPPSTQWELIDAASQTPELIYEALSDFAAQGELLHNDDTHMRVQSLRREMAAPNHESERTGIFTTGIIAKVGAVQVALFFTGPKHAGENLDQLLRRRATQREQPLLMCDALSRNEPKEFHALLCNCLLHGRRQFVEVVESFPQECRKVIESLREVYRFEATAKREKLSDAQRLAFHQAQSKPVMDDLQKWMQEQLDQKQVEPNSSLGQAINYMLKRWEPLTRFLSVAGAPLDNNIVERALKMAILHRKNSLSFKTLHGARVGDIHMSLIHTCELNRVNPFHYMMALQRHASRLAKEPARWLPWNYQQTIAAADTG